MKFKVGDRVVYHMDGRSGNCALEGWAGKIIGIDKSAIPYTVEFDNYYGQDAAEDRRFGGKKGHCWHCSEKHLTPEEEEKQEPEHANRLEGFEPYKKGETKMEPNNVWTPEEDAKITQMKAEGKTAQEIASALGRSFSAVNTRWYNLKKAREQGDEKTPETIEKTEGEMSALEKTMSEIITEQKGEIDRLNGAIKDLERSLCKAHEENTRLLDQIGVLTEKAASLESDHQDTATTLAKTEEQLDEALQSGRDTELELKKARERLEALEGDSKIGADLVRDKEATISRMREMIAKKDSKIEELETNLNRATNVALGMAEKFLQSDVAVFN